MSFTRHPRDVYSPRRSSSLHGGGKGVHTGNDSHVDNPYDGRETYRGGFIPRKDARLHRYEMNSEDFRQRKPRVQLHGAGKDAVTSTDDNVKRLLEDIRRLEEENRRLEAALESYRERDRLEMARLGYQEGPVWGGGL